MRRFMGVVGLAGLLMGGAVAAQDAVTPGVTVSDQVILENTVTVGTVTSAGPGWIAIHADNNGAPGRVAGLAAVDPGLNNNVVVSLDPAAVTPVLYAMLHTDDGTVGAYEFDGQSGIDGPVLLDGAVIAPAFNIALLDAHDQLVDGLSVTVSNVVMSGPGWLVIHSDRNGAPGPVYGEVPVPAGGSSDLRVMLPADANLGVLWPMLHLDDGAVGSYEFDGVSGIDNPVVLGGQMAVAPLFTVPHVRVQDQIAMRGDGQIAPMVVPTVTVQSVLSRGPGWMVIHTDNNGSPGPIAGLVAVADGFTPNVEVVLDRNSPTPVLYAMLHTDDGVVGTYEFDGVSGVDAPVMVNGAEVTPAFNVAPSMTLAEQTEPGVVVIPSALIDAAGWLVVHADNNGAPGAVLGSAPLRAGNNVGIRIAVDPAAAGAQVFAMLHYDTGEVGVFEFGTVDGADLPVSVGGSVVVAPLATAQ